MLNLLLASININLSIFSLIFTLILFLTLAKQQEQVNLFSSYFLIFLNYNKLMPDYPTFYKLNCFKPPNDSSWEFGDKIVVLFDRPVYYRFKRSKNGFYFVREDIFFRNIQEKKNKKKEDSEVISLYRQLDEFKTQNGCQICGYNKHPRAINFDHFLPAEKSHSISSLASSFAKAGKKNREIIKNLIIEEIKKCILLCANCHQEKTAINKCGQDKLRTNYVSMADYMKQNGKSDVAHLTIDTKSL